MLHFISQCLKATVRKRSLASINWVTAREIHDFFFQCLALLLFSLSFTPISIYTLDLFYLQSEFM